MNENITLQEVFRKKTEAENNIKKILLDFSGSTGLPVDTVLVTAKRLEASGREILVHFEVHMEVKL